MPARILSPTPEHLQLAAAALLRGDVVGMPTETVYGLAGLGCDERALAKIFSTKDRPTFDPLIVHVARPEDLLPGEEFNWLAFLEESRLVDQRRLNSSAKARVAALARLWPGPLTMVLPKQPSVPDLATSGLPTVAIRAPRHPVAQALLRATGQPLAAPSANRFGRISPTCASDVQAELGDRLELILDGGVCEIGLESTVVQVAEDGEVLLLRPGAITCEAIEIAIGTSVHFPATRGRGDLEASRAQVAPGQLASHYAPAKPLYLLPTSIVDLGQEVVIDLLKQFGQQRNLGLLLYQDSPPDAVAQFLRRLAIDPLAVSHHVCSLSSAGDPAEAARNLFRRLRELDAHPGVGVILAEPVPDESGLGYAIADRMRRASRSEHL